MKRQRDLPAIVNWRRTGSNHPRSRRTKRFSRISSEAVSKRCGVLHFVGFGSAVRKVWASSISGNSGVGEKPSSAGGEDVVGFEGAVGRLIQPRQRQRRAQLERTRALFAVSANGPEDRRPPTDEASRHGVIGALGFRRGFLRIESRCIKVRRDPGGQCPQNVRRRLAAACTTGRLPPIGARRARRLAGAVAVRRRNARCVAQRAGGARRCGRCCGVAAAAAGAALCARPLIQQLAVVAQTPVATTAGGERMTIMGVPGASNRRQARSSIGQSPQLITATMEVQVLPGPPSQ